MSKHMTNDQTVHTRAKAAGQPRAWWRSYLS